jgi:hypothetical protein
MGRAFADIPTCHRIPLTTELPRQDVESKERMASVYVVLGAAVFMAFVDKREAFCPVVMVQYPTEEGIEWAACISRLKGLRQGEILRRSTAAYPEGIVTANGDGISVLIARAAQIG